MPRALIVVDIQNDYFPGGANPLDAPEAAASQASRLLDAFRASGEHVVHVQHVWDEPDAPFMRPGTPGRRDPRGRRAAAGRGRAAEGVAQRVPRDEPGGRPARTGRGRARGLRDDDRHVRRRDRPRRRRPRLLHDRRPRRVRDVRPRVRRRVRAGAARCTRPSSRRWATATRRSSRPTTSSAAERTPSGDVGGRVGGLARVVVVGRGLEARRERRRVRAPVRHVGEDAAAGRLLGGGGRLGLLRPVDVGLELRLQRPAAAARPARRARPPARCALAGRSVPACATVHCWRSIPIGSPRAP